MTITFENKTKTKTSITYEDVNSMFLNNKIEITVNFETELFKQVIEGKKKYKIIIEEI